MKRWLYFAAATGVCGLLSTAVVVIYLYCDFGLDTRSVAPAQRLICPGQHIVELPDTGLHYVYFENVVSYDSVTYAMDSLPCSTSVTVKNGAVGRVGPIRPAESTVRYSWPERAGLSLVEFDVLNPGDLLIDVSFDTQMSHGPLVFAVGSASSMVSMIKRGVTLFWVSFLLLYSAAIVLWKRRVRRNLTPPQAVGHPA